MPRVNIYMSKELRAEMLERPKLNWSNIARRAFLIEIAKADKERKSKEAEIIEPLLCLSS